MEEGEKGGATSLYGSEGRKKKLVIAKEKRKKRSRTATWGKKKGRGKRSLKREEGENARVVPGERSRKKKKDTLASKEFTRKEQRPRGGEEGKCVTKRRLRILPREERDKAVPMDRGETGSGAGGARGCPVAVLGLGRKGTESPGLPTIGRKDEAVERKRQEGHQKEVGPYGINDILKRRGRASSQGGP